MYRYDFIDGRSEIEVSYVSYAKGYPESIEVARFHVRDHHDIEQAAIDFIDKLEAAADDE